VGVDELPAGVPGLDDQEQGGHRAGGRGGAADGAEGTASEPEGGGGGTRERSGSARWRGVAVVAASGSPPLGLS
jgi:hypothetical protein